MPRCLVTGAGGFIGGHLVRRLLYQGHRVRAVDIKLAQDWWILPDPRYGNVEVWAQCDLEKWHNCQDSCQGMDYVYNLAASMGGMGYIETHKCDCAMNVLISAHMLKAAHAANCLRFFYSSSACAYAAQNQDRPDCPALKETDAYPAMPEDGYGWEKLYSERLCRHWMEDYGLETRVARFHNVYGPHTSWNDGREKAPAAICRKIAAAKQTGNHSIDVWGDGTRTRSFMWIDDCLLGIEKIMASNIREPINLGSAESVTINQLIDVVSEIAGISVDRVYDMTKPQGVHGRNSDNTLIKSLLGWEPKTPLQTGLEKTYQWIEQQVLGIPK